MNYTTILIDNKKIGLKFGLASFRYLKDKFVEGKSFENNELTEIGIAHILYSGYYNNCIIKDVELEYSFEYFVDFVESNLNNQDSLIAMKDIISLWSENDFIKKEEIDSKKPEAKKKTIRGKK